MKKKPGRKPGVVRMTPSDREVKFAQIYVQTHNKSQAFRECGYSCGKMDSTAIASNAHRIWSRPCVQAEIERMERAAEAARAEAYKEEVKEQLSQWSREDSLDALKTVVQEASRAMRKPIVGADGEIVDYSFDSSAARVVRDAVESLNKMQGYNEPEKSEVDAVISVAFADGSDYSV